MSDQAAALARCDREIEQIRQEARQREMPAWLVVLGIQDWEAEKRLIYERSNAITDG